MASAIGVRAVDSYAPAVGAAETETLRAPRRTLWIVVVAVVAGFMIALVAQCALFYLFVLAQPGRPASEPAVPLPIEETASATSSPSPTASR